MGTGYYYFGLKSNNDSAKKLAFGGCLVILRAFEVIKSCFSTFIFKRNRENDAIPCDKLKILPNPFGQSLV